MARTGILGDERHEISTYGEALLVDDLGLFMGWEYDAVEVWPSATVGADYLDQPALQAALAELGALAAERPYVDLYE